VTRLYNTYAWQRKRHKQLQREPLCKLCSDVGLITPATVADHITPHKGSVQSFWDGKLQSLCKHCHDSIKARIEHRGYDITIGADGYPVDEGHRFYE
jgi:5-methylcytosine-specific restriction protein A